MKSNQSKSSHDFTIDDKTNGIADARKALDVLLSIAADPDCAKNEVLLQSLR